MDGDDDLFAVFDAADENTEDKPIQSSTSTEKKVRTMDLVTNTVLGTSTIIIDVPTITNISLVRVMAPAWWQRSVERRDISP